MLQYPSTGKLGKLLCEGVFIHDSIQKLFTPWCMYAYSQPPWGWYTKGSLMLFYPIVTLEPFLHTVRVLNAISFFCPELFCVLSHSYRWIPKNPAITVAVFSPFRWSPLPFFDHFFLFKMSFRLHSPRAVVSHMLRSFFPSSSPQEFLLIRPEYRPRARKTAIESFERCPLRSKHAGGMQIPWPSDVDAHRFKSTRLWPHL